MLEFRQANGRGRSGFLFTTAILSIYYRLFSWCSFASKLSLWHSSSSVHGPNSMSCSTSLAVRLFLSAGYWHFPKTIEKEDAGEHPALLENLEVAHDFLDYLHMVRRTRRPKCRPSQAHNPVAQLAAQKRNLRLCRHEHERNLVVAGFQQLCGIQGHGVGPECAFDNQVGTGFRQRVYEGLR